jgi:hypothetical protein
LQRRSIHRLILSEQLRLGSGKRQQQLIDECLHNAIANKNAGVAIADERVIVALKTAARAGAAAGAG